ncbi:hydrolase [Actinoalloteichus sp. AHMU CJ021]|uniref:Amidohydrolase n=3 Tax=Actinoalloteichus TaxID=65496 RepID=A0ABT1JPS1_ACTCY|nr:carbon-nitrogen hydrolase family protein [Actinoalloteichus caeruleus]AUS80275.1 hydrolase [Actinoalloteichus sp. AHMU CJ021]MCP2334518.1 putative amidohydrolase [Actinoalloteichus caeruleus DSM 43889]
MAGSLRVALCQLSTTPDPASNLELVRHGAAEAAAAGAQVVVFPEATMACFGIPLRPLAEGLEGPWATEVRRIAAQYELLVVAGMFTPAPNDRVTNTLLVTGRGVDTYYDKIHLYDAFGFQESATVASGDRLVSVEVEGMRLGFATCYDLRFPALFTRLAAEGAEAVVVPASWGAGPGKLRQWELLVRARALDSTSWVLACGQALPDGADVEQAGGRAPTGVGHSMVVDPLGTVRVAAGSAPEVVLAGIDSARVAAARDSVPVLANQRL